LPVGFLRIRKEINAHLRKDILLATWKCKNKSLTGSNAVTIALKILRA